MALTPSISSAARSAAADAVTTLINAGTPPGLLRIYSGTIPTDANTALGAQVLLGTLTMANPAFAAAAAGVATAGAIASDTSADATGTASFFRILNAAGVCILQGSVGTSAADLVLSSTAITLGGTIAVSAFTFTQQGS